jgi:two-component system, chemotaxis family, sensor kinase CheA
MDDLLAEFIAETREMLEATSSEIVAWEADPADSSRLDAIFRFVHTVKGNCGFFDFPRLAQLSHAAEDTLADLRAGRREADSALVSAVLAIIDRIAAMADAIEAGEELSADDDATLIAALAGDAQPAPTTPPSSLTEPVTTRRSDSTASTAASQRTIRLPVELLDRVMIGVSDMVLARNDLAHRLRESGNQPTIDGPFERLTTILADVRDAITRMRMQRIETLFGALPRLVRDLATELDKQVSIDLEGGNVELDREMIETMRDPITHLIRNAIDHGLESPAERRNLGKDETGRVTMAAHQSGNTISIVISDDGRGLDEEKIAAKALATGLITPPERAEMGRDRLLQVIFEPGFSTAEAVSNVSGRGVGLDVVRQNLEKVGGSIKVSSQPGLGTMFTLQIPLTLSIIAGLTVEAGGQRFAIPQSYIEEIVQASTQSLDLVEMGETTLITFRGQRIPCLDLAQVLGLPQRDLTSIEPVLVMLRLASDDVFALTIDGIHSHGDLVVKPLAPAVMQCGLYAGSALLDDGQPVLFLDIPNIAVQHGLVFETRARRLHRGETQAAEADAGQSVQAMVFTDFAGKRCAVRMALVRRIETLPSSAIDLSGPSPRAVIDGAILPLVGLPQEPLAKDYLRLLRLSDGNSDLLYAVGAVNDAVGLTGELTSVPDDPLAEAVTLVDGSPVTLIDGHELFARHGAAPRNSVRTLCRIPDDDWAHTILTPMLKAAGYTIIGDDDEAEGKVVSIINDEIFEAANALGRAPEGPVIRLRDHPEAPKGSPTIYRYDREALTAALQAAKRGELNRMSATQ